MAYPDYINLIFSIISWIYSIMMIHFVIFGIVGLFKKKKFPETKTFNRYGLIIPARNEEKVVGGLIESILNSDYPKDKLEIFVIAHNCTDSTAQVARSYGDKVHVVEYNNPEECTMGYAFRYLFKQIEKDYGTQNFDGFFLFNADNIVAKNYFNKMNDAFEYYEKKNIVTSFRNSKNFGTNLISGLYGVYFQIGCVYEARGRVVLGKSTRVQGTGYVIPASLVKEGWNYVTLTEDWEFSADQIISNHKIKYCDDAVFYDEQPTSFKIMWRQRVRWSRGHLLICITRLKDLIKHLFVKNNKDRISSYDIFTNCLPFCLIFFIIGVIQFLLLAITPLIDKEMTLTQIFIGNNFNIITSQAYVPTLVRNVITSYVSTFLMSVLIFIVERKRIHNVSFIKKVFICLFWPLFLLIQFPIDVQALFSRNLGWKEIPHSDTTKVINEQQAETASAK